MAHPYVEDGEAAQVIAESQGLPSPPTSIKQKRVERSCLLCHQRKVRCDKKSPCSNCARADAVCSYPGPDRPGRRLPKSNIAEVAQRVDRLERKIAAFSNDVPHTDPNVQSTSDSNSSLGEDNQGAPSGPNDRSGEILVQDGPSTRYINDSIFSRVLEEERDMNSVFESPNSIRNPGGRAAPLDMRGIFSGFNQSMTDVRGYYPSRWHAMQLWQAFVTNVDPIIKILHVPTAQATVYAAINSPHNLKPDLDALLFSIYFAATTSLTSAASASLLEEDKSVSLSKYKQGLEQSLAAANILDTPSLMSLQAMTIYLTCLRAYSGGRAVWTLTGLAIRSAQSIGLHRDGTNFNLSPFECEVRRRLWNYLCAIDSRAAEDHGIAVSAFDGESDTRLPANVDDCDLFPNVQDLPPARQKWTDMTFSLIMFEIGRAISQLYKKSDDSSPSSNQYGSPGGDSKLKSLETRLEAAYLRHCDPNIPIQNATRLCTNLMMSKLRFLVTHPWLNRRNGEQNMTQADDETLLAACYILETNLQLQSEDLLRGFRWYFETYTQHHLLTYVLWHLCSKPLGPGVEQAWNAVNSSFAVAENREVVYQVGSRWKVLQSLKEKALRIRQSYDIENGALSPGLGGALRMNVSAGELDMPPLRFDESFWDFATSDFDMMPEFDIRYIPK